MATTLPFSRISRVELRVDLAGDGNHGIHPVVQSAEAVGSGVHVDLKVGMAGA